MRLMDLNQQGPTWSPAEEAALIAGLNAARTRVFEATQQFRDENGYADASAKTLTGQTIVTNSLLMEAALNAAISAVISNDDPAYVCESLIDVFRRNFDQAMALVLTTILSTPAESYDGVEGEALAARLVTDLVTKARASVAAAGGV